MRDSTGIPPTSLNRLLSKLIDCGYVQKIRHGEYRAGPGLVALGSSVMENAGTIRFRPMLNRLVEKTGLNAELYSLTQHGPTLLTWIGGRSEFRVRMFPGFRLPAMGHPATAFFKQHFPAATQAWDKSLDPEMGGEDWRRMLHDAEENFIIERGQIRPELGRACAATSDGAYCIGLSGLLSEFVLTDEELKNILLNELMNFEEN